MDEKQKDGSAMPDQSDSVHEQESQSSTNSGANSDFVKHDTYRRTLSEAKKYKNQVGELQSKLTEFEQNQLSNEGRKDELIESLRKEVGEWRGKATKAVSSFAKSKVNEVMITEASKLGCQDPDLILKAYGSDIEGIDFDDQFDPDKDQIRITLDRVKQERPYLFNKSAPKVGSHQIKTGEIKDSEPKATNSMNDDELMSAWAKSNT